MKKAAASMICLLSGALMWSAEQPRTEITKWQDGKRACVSITYDDSTINQFRIAVPLMNERRLPGTFFVITGGIQGSKNQPTFVGRPIMDIIRESESNPTTRENLLERVTMLNYLQTIQRVPELKGFSAQRLERAIQQGSVAEVAKVIDPFLAALRQTGATYAAGPRKPSGGERRNAVTWDELRRYAAKGHEMVTHSLDKKLYDLPLTARTVIPADWKLVRFRQGSDIRWLPIYRDGDSSYVLYRIAPDGTAATLERVAN